MIVCITCQTEKPDSGFYIRDKTTGARFNECKSCKADRQRRARAADPEKYRGMNTRWRDANRERRNASARKSQSTPEAKAKQRAWRESNREREKAYQRDYRDRTRWARIERQYGISMADYMRMVEDQNGKCPICRSDLGDVMIHIDHCHDTGKVRGLLCPTCNQALGLLKEDVGTAARAAAYLRGAYLT